MAPGFDTAVAGTLQGSLHEVPLDIADRRGAGMFPGTPVSGPASVAGPMTPKSVATPTGGMLRQVVGRGAGTPGTPGTPGGMAGGNQELREITAAGLSETHSGPVHALAALGGGMLATVGSDACVRVWDVDRKVELW